MSHPILIGNKKYYYTTTVTSYDQLIDLKTRTNRKYYYIKSYNPRTKTTYYKVYQR